MSKKIFRETGVIIVSLLLGVGVAYATFLSNVLSISNNTISSGEAAIKLCDVVGTNRWTTGLNPVTSLSQMIPGEERNVYLGRTIEIGNDGGGLATAVGGSQCTAYTGTPSQSNTPLKIIPTVSFSSDSCSSTLPADINLRFEIGSISSAYQSIQAWSTNATPIDTLLNPNSASQFKAYAQLSSTATTQATSCAFTINLTGKQS